MSRAYLRAKTTVVFTQKLPWRKVISMKLFSLNGQQFTNENLNVHKINSAYNEIGVDQKKYRNKK